jgi:hypothetical protein
MGGLFGGGTKTTQAAQQPALGAVNVSSSAYGLVIPLVWGTNRVSGNMLWYGDFVATSHDSGGGGGGGKGGGSGSGGGSVTYTYSASFAEALCDGPIADIGVVWRAKALTTVSAMGGTLFSGADGQSRWAYMDSRHPTQSLAYSGLAYVGFPNLNLGDAADSPNLSFEVKTPSRFNPTAGSILPVLPFAVPRFPVNGDVVAFTTGAAKGLTAKVEFFTPATVELATYGTAYTPATFVVAPAKGDTFKFTSGANAGKTGTVSSCTANVLTFAQPLTLVAAPADGDVLQFTSGNSNGTSFTVYGFNEPVVETSQSLTITPAPGDKFTLAGGSATLSSFASGGYILDALPSVVIGDFLTRAGFPAAKIGDLSAYAGYCQASGLFISPALTEQTAANSTLQEWATATNSEFVWANGLLTVVPYGDTAVSGYGANFIPNLTPAYDLGDDDFCPNDGDDPVVCTRPDLADAYNQYSVEYLDRANSYNTAVVTVEDAAHIDIYGPRPASSVQAHYILDGATATHVAQMIMRRALWIKATYAFTLAWKHCRLDAMDLVTLTDSGLGLSRELVRITEIEEDEEGRLAVKAEEVQIGTAAPAAYQTQSTTSFAHDFNADPGDANAPVIFEPTVALAASGLEVWVASSGGALWGGADVWISLDGETYAWAGAIKSRCRHGVLTAAMTTASGLASSNLLAVDLTVSNGALTAASATDAAAYASLCYVDGEFLSYTGAQLTAASCYTLSGLYRGAYGSSVGNHAVGASFVRIDQALFKYPFTKDMIGQTISVKLLSYNLWGGAQYQLSEVAAHTHTIKGPPAPPLVQGFSVAQSGGAVGFSWQPITSDNALKGYDIGYAPLGTTAWAAFTLLTEAAAGTEMTNASVPPGTWVFGIVARDIVDQLSPAVAMVTATISNVQQIVDAPAQGPAWLGSLSGFVRHWSGVLIPDSSQPASALTNAQLFEQFVPAPVPISSYTAPAIDTGAVDQLRVWGIESAQLGGGGSAANQSMSASALGQGNVNTSLAIDWSSDGVSYNGAFQPWTVGNVTARFIKAQLVQTNSSGGCVVTGFTPTIDVPSKTDTGSGASASPVAVAAGGTAITFSQPFHQPPNVQASPAGVGLTGASAVNITATGCTLHAWTGSADSGGLVSWKATGP